MEKTRASKFFEALQHEPRNEYGLANLGDKLAAKQAIGQLIQDLYFANMPDEKIGAWRPMPPATYEYLKEALIKIESGEDANVAFNLKKSGKAIWPYQDKLNAAQLVHQFVLMGDPLDQAVEKTQSQIMSEYEIEKAEKAKSYLSKFPNFARWGLWARMGEASISEPTIREWYRRLKPKFDEIMTKIEK